MDNHIFALDIGTRSVTGIILEKQDENFTLKDYCSEEHQVRAMQDGQIHHVIDVANVITSVTNKLEETHGRLDKVSIAAAGRSLKTMQGSAMISINGQPIDDEEIVKHLELTAVQNAQSLLIHDGKSDKSNADYYCVGYSVLHYELDGVQIGSLIDQKGQQATVEVIATFLPKVVIESLLAALKRADLEMDALTLEPIAAINVLVPESMRKLNVALVDIGAGTSDIAITNYGTVIAYGMVPHAGDAITEAISQHFLLDFPVAEKLKKDIVNQGYATVNDILGFETEIGYEELTTAVDEYVENLSQSISDEVFRLNKKTPQAVMLIGGGSLTPELTNKLSNKLGLPANRVAVRDINAIGQINKTDNLPTGPDFVTPIGIAISAHQNPIHYVSMQVNNQSLRMFQLKELTIGDALIHAGLDITQFYGKPGMGYCINVNDKEITVPGSYGQAPNIELNGQPANIETLIVNNDKITITKGLNGRSPDVTIGELIDDIPAITFYINNEKKTIKSTINVNNKHQSKDYIINDKDTIQIRQPKTIKDILTQISSEKLPTSDGFKIYVNSKVIKLTGADTQVLLNGNETSSNTIIKDNDELIIKSDKEPILADLLEQLKLTYFYSMKVTFNGKPVILEQPRVTVYRNDTLLALDSTLSKDDHLKLTELKRSSFIFQDVFRYVDLDLSKITGSFKIMINDKLAGFDDTINDHDALTIKWD